MQIGGNAHRDRYAAESHDAGLPRKVEVLAQHRSRDGLIERLGISLE